MMLDMHSSNRKVIIGASSTYVLTFLLFFVNVTKMLRFLRSEMEIEALTRNGEMRERDERERGREREGGRREDAIATKGVLLELRKLPSFTQPQEGEHSRTNRQQCSFQEYSPA
jgi:hypothetical protein